MAYKKRKRSRFSTIVGLACCGIMFYVTAQTIQTTFFEDDGNAMTLSNKMKKQASVTTNQANAEYETKKMVQVYTVPEKDFDKLGTSQYDVYSEASTTSTMISTVYVGEWLDYLGESGEMTQIRTLDGQEGYIQTKLIQQIQDISIRSNHSMQKYTVMLDPGHGGDDPGSLDNTETYQEKDFTLTAAKTIKSQLEQSGITVYLTRDDDTSVALDQRVADAVEVKPDLYISIHFDSNESANTMSGFTTYYYYERDKALANAINQSLVGTLPLDNVGLRQENHLVTRENPYPAILLELGYMNSDYDVSVVQKDAYLEQVSQGILDGLVNYYKE